MEKLNTNTPVITAVDHLHFMLNHQLTSLIELAHLHRKAFGNRVLQDCYARDLARGNPTKFFLDFCTVRLALPHRSGLTTWCQRNLPENALYIARDTYNPKSFKCRVAQPGLQGVDLENPPDLIVIDDAGWYDPEIINRIYRKLGKNPETQLFLLLG